MQQASIVGIGIGIGIIYWSTEIHTVNGIVIAKKIHGLIMYSVDRETG